MVLCCCRVPSCPSAVGLKERWDAPGSDSGVGRTASILSSLCPFPRITLWLCLGPWRHSILVSGTQQPLSQSRVSQPLSRLLCGPCLCALDVNSVDFIKNNTIAGPARIQCLLVESKGGPQQRSIGDNGYLKVCFCPCSGIIPSCLLIWPFIHSFIQLIYSLTHFD